MKKYTLKEWREKGESLFGKDLKTWKFICPACGNVSSIQDFINLGQNKESAWNCAYNECIGRYTNAGSPQEDKKPCNWAAYGFLKTLGKGVIIEIEEGKEIEIFDFYTDENQTIHE